jgi:hypothetical protein
MVAVELDEFGEKGENECKGYLGSCQLMRQLHATEDDVPSPAAAK